MKSRCWGILIARIQLPRQEAACHPSQEKIITVVAPLLLPENTMEFMIKGIVHCQSSEGGTTTDILLCRSDGFGSGSGEPLRE